MNWLEDYGPFLISLLLVGLLVWFFVASQNNYEERMKTTPCSQFSEQTVRNVPVRCLKGLTK